MFIEETNGTLRLKYRQTARLTFLLRSRAL